MKFIVVENRDNETFRLCSKSAELANVSLDVISEVEAGAEFDCFSNKYVHYSTNSRSFELICFRRYFLLKNYLLKNPSLKEFILIDSDVLLFPGVESHVAKMIKADILASWVSGQSDIFKMVSPHLSYWSRDSILEFVDFLIDFYSEEKNRVCLENCYSYFINQGLRGGVTDMTLLFFFIMKKKLGGESMSRIVDEATIDHNISVADNYELNEFKSLLGFKLLVIGGDGVYGFRRGGGRVRFYALHFQGKAKVLMRACLNGQWYIFYPLLIVVGLGKLYKKIIFKFFGRFF